MAGEAAVSDEGLNARGDEADPGEDEEFAALGKIAHAMLSYRQTAMLELQRWIANFRRLSAEHQAHMPGFAAKVAHARAAVHQNQRVLDAIVQQGDRDIGAAIEAAQAHAEASKGVVAAVDVSKVRYVLKNLTRDWSASGAEERAQSYGWIVSALHRYMPPPADSHHPPPPPGPPNGSAPAAAPPVSAPAGSAGPGGAGARAHPRSPGDSAAAASAQARDVPADARVQQANGSSPAPAAAESGPPPHPNLQPPSVSPSAAASDAQPHQRDPRHPPGGLAKPSAPTHSLTAAPDNAATPPAMPPSEPAHESGAGVEARVLPASPPPESGPPRVLVPGCGLARLAVDIAAAGYEAVANEFSFFMLLTSSFVLNGLTEAGGAAVHPWVLSTSNQRSDAQQLRRVLLPDDVAAEAVARRGGSISMVTGDFVEVFSAGEYRGAFGAVATSFFIDTAHNVIAYLEVIYALLQPGGYWVNVGPLLYHWADSTSDDPSLELSLEGVRAVATRIGFSVVEESEAQAAYLADPECLYQTTYTVVRWVMQKGGAEGS